VEQTLLGARPGLHSSGLMRPLQRRIQAYFEGEPVAFGDTPLWCTGLSSFSQEVYVALAKVPAGTTVSYGELAGLAGHPGAARAVGRAMSANPTPLVVPCHRVLSAGGGLGGFSAQGGVVTKKRLLEHEKDILVHSTGAIHVSG